MVTFTQTYPTDLKYTEWQLISEFFPSHNFGRPPKWEKWQILNGILYANRTGGQWRMLPMDYPPWKTVYYYLTLRALIPNPSPEGEGSPLSLRERPG